MADFTETENDDDVMSNYGSDRVFDIEDQFHSCKDKRKISRDRKCFRKSFKSWDIDKKRLLQLTKLSLMELPQRTIHVLSKMIINRQITEIGKVIKIRRNCITIRVKVNLQNANYRDLVYEDVLLKVFTRKNHTKPDIETAKNSSHQRLLDRHVLQQSNETCYYNNFMHSTKKDNLIIMRIDSIVIIRSVDSTPRLQSLEDVLKNNPYRRLPVLKNLLELVKALRESDYLFWNQLTSMKNIFYNNDAWSIVYTNQESSRANQHKQSLKNFTENIAALVNLFHRFGVPMIDLKYTCFQVFKSDRRGFSHVLSQLNTKFNWSLPKFVFYM